MTINEIKQQFLLQPVELIPNLLQHYKTDPRQGVQKLCKQYDNQYRAYIKDKIRIESMRDFDQVFSRKGQYIMAGIDEAGRGPLAGPVVAAAVILPDHHVINGIDDSKKLTENQRNLIYDQIMDLAVSVGIGIVDANTIDKINILQATFRAMKKALFSLAESSEVVLVDGNQTIPGINLNMTQHAVIKGDSKSNSIAAASIIAKVTRDRMMLSYHEQYPEYGFNCNKGYGSLAHQEVIRKIGPSPIHRKSFLKNITKNM